MMDRKKRFYDNVILEDVEVPRMVDNCNCNDAQRHQGWRRGG
jgi:hypothetical protein